MTQTATLDELKPGHEYPGASLNARTTGREEDLEPLIASIKVEGILQSLLVCPGPKGGKPFYVIAGNRRLAALRKLKWDQDIPVVVRENVTPGSALAMSLAENVTQCPLHPVDRFEAFAGLITAGKTETFITISYGVSYHVVKQSLALGRLSPKIRAAWRNGDLDADEVKAFTLGKDHKAQDAVFDKLKKNHRVNAYMIRQMLVGDQQETKRFMTLVGRAAYEAAGGKVQVDLFARSPGAPSKDEDEDDDDGELLVSDQELLVRLVGEKITERCKQLIADGWAWADEADDLPSGWDYNWRKIAALTAAASKAQKEKAGCAVQVDYDGKLKITYGLLKPGARVEREPSKNGVAAPNNKISNSLKADLEGVLARGTREALLTDTYPAGITETLAKVIASQIRVPGPGLGTTPNAVGDKLRAIRDGITPKVLIGALQKGFDPKQYFPRAPKTLVVKAVAETMGKDHSAKLAKGTKAAAWKFALANVPKTWLPPELRTEGYNNPTAKSVAALKRKAA